MARRRLRPRRPKVRQRGRPKAVVPVIDPEDLPILPPAIDPEDLPILPPKPRRKRRNPDDIPLAERVRKLQKMKDKAAGCPGYEVQVASHMRKGKHVRAFKRCIRSGVKMSLNKMFGNVGRGRMRYRRRLRRRGRGIKDFLRKAHNWIKSNKVLSKAAPLLRYTPLAPAADAIGQAVSQLGYGRRRRYRRRRGGCSMRRRRGHGRRRRRSRYGRGLGMMASPYSGTSTAVPRF